MNTSAFSLPHKYMLYKLLYEYNKVRRVRDVAQTVAFSPVKVGILRSSLHGGCICRLGYFPSMVHQPGRSKAVVCVVLSMGNCI